MSRFYTVPGSLDKESARITGEDHRHLSKVLRLRPGDRIELRDGEGSQADGVIESVTREETIVSVTNKKEASGENRSARLSLYQGIPKQSKMESIAQKCTELGAVSFHPFYAKRSVPKPSKSDSKKNPAAQQSRL